MARLSSEEAIERLKSRVALTRMWFTSTNIEPPSSIGIEGSDHAFTVVVRPPIYEERSKTVILVGIEEDAA